MAEAAWVSPKARRSDGPVQRHGPLAFADELVLKNASRLRPPSLRPQFFISQVFNSCVSGDGLEEPAWTLTKEMGAQALSGPKDSRNLLRTCNRSQTPR
jgi:hypothetical protein